MASSLVATVERPGQGTYSAANTFLEAFCQYRHSLGLPPSVLNICPIRDVGYIADHEHAERSVKISGLYSLGEREFLDFLDLDLLKGHPVSKTDAPSHMASKPWINEVQVIMGLRPEKDLDDPDNRTIWRRNRRMGIFHNLRQAASNDPHTTAKTNALADFLARSSGVDGKAMLVSKDVLEFLVQAIGRKIYDLVLKPDEQVKTEMTLAHMGVDSLMAIELRGWIRDVWGIQVSVFEIMAVGSLEQLAELTSVKLRERFHGVEEK